MSYTSDIGNGLRVGDFVRILAKGKWLHETGVVVNLYGYGFDRTVRVLFTKSQDGLFREREVEFMEREVEA